jgi:hypothetical protein
MVVYQGKVCDHIFISLILLARILWTYNGILITMYKKTPMTMKVRSLVFSSFLVLLLTVSMSLSGQDGSSPLFSGEPPVYSSTPHFGMQVGSSFTSGLIGGSMFTHSLAPSFNWDVSRRFNLQVGTIFSSTTMNGMNPLFPYSPQMAGGVSLSMYQGQRLFSSTVYAVGSYQVSPRLTLIGGTWLEQNNMHDVMMNSQAFDSRPRGGMFGFDYRITENLRIGAEFNVSSGYNPFNPVYNLGGYGSSFDRNSGFHRPSPFHRGSGW